MPRQAVNWYPQRLSYPAYILSNEEVFHRRVLVLVIRSYTNVAKVAASVY